MTHLIGESAWTWDAGRGQYSPHSFLSTMPDLNWRNQAVMDAIGPE
ncbi:alpha-amylase family glycosyl hydrolase [Streptomyces sp. P9-2B-2]